MLLRLAVGLLVVCYVYLLQTTMKPGKSPGAARESAGKKKKQKGQSEAIAEQ